MAKEKPLIDRLDGHGDSTPYRSSLLSVSAWLVAHGNKRRDIDQKMSVEWNAVLICDHYEVTELSILIIIFIIAD